MPTLNISILGGTGFVGRRISSRLVLNGHNVRVLTRRRERHRHMLVHPTLSLIEGDVNELGFLREQFQDADVVINLVGILNSDGKDNFQKLHVELPKKVVEAMQQTGVRRLLHMSALNASKEGPSRYLRSKGAAEETIHDMTDSGDYAVTIFRPSVIFGPEDGFMNRFAGLLRIPTPFFPLACPGARFQPVYVDDVASCFLAAIDNRGTYDQTYNLCGPKTYTLYELVTYIADLTGVRCRIVQLSDWQSRLQASLMRWLPGKPFTPDNYNSMKVDSVCDGPFPAIFDMTPKPLEAVAPAYLRRRENRLDVYRKFSRR